VKTLESKSVVLLHHHLKALRLPTIGAECEKVAKQAAADNAYSDDSVHLVRSFRTRCRRPRSGRRLRALSP
jgi:hypothetical protein